MLEVLWAAPWEPFLLMWSPGLPELLIIGAVAVLMFGKRIPEVARSMGRGITEFKKGIKDDPERDRPEEEASSGKAPASREQDPAMKP